MRKDHFMLPMINWSIILEPLTVSNLLIVLGMSTLFGMTLAFVYHITHYNNGYDRSFMFTLLIMPLVVAIIVLLVSNNLARAFSLAGVFTLVRFRLAMTDSSDLAYILASVGTGLAAALGYLSVGIIITLFLAVILTILSLLLLNKNDQYAKLVVTMPEHLNVKHALSEVLKNHTKSFKIEKIKTSDFGTLYKITYKLVLPKNIDEKQLFDDIRLINGNLDIALFEDYHISVEEKN